jgi:hypothetical protein
MQKFILTFKTVFTVCLGLLLLTTSIWQPTKPEEAIRYYTRPYEFDFVSWTFNAFSDKLSMSGFGFKHYLTYYQGRRILKDYFQLLSEKENLENSLQELFTNPEILDPHRKSQFLRKNLSVTEARLKNQSSLAEVVLQDQLSRTLEDLGLTFLSQPFPPVLYHVTPLPKELIVSPRDEIEQAASVSLQADMDLEEMVLLEEDVEANSEYSALVVSIGGISTYPTMVINSGNLPYLLETIAHEWMHNYLIFKPLGMHYSASTELRTMNETTANIVGEEVSSAVMYKYYQNLMPDKTELPEMYEASYHLKNTSSDQVVTDFNQFMYETRIRVDELLAQGKVEEAESYMEDRRKILWDSGYQIRKLNQAYFAFHGAYADKPYSAAGEDPVGEAVRTLRLRSRSLAEFIHKMSALSSYEELYQLVNTF